MTTPLPRPHGITTPAPVYPSQPFGIATPNTYGTYSPATLEARAAAQLALKLPERWALIGKILSEEIAFQAAPQWAKEPWLRQVAAQVRDLYAVLTTGQQEAA